jgi:hypothetical protein
MFKKVRITQEMVDRASKRAAKIPNTINTFMNFERHKVGFIGEEIFMKAFPMAQESFGNNVYYYDYILGKRKVEIKTKMCTTIPSVDYECSIYNYFEQDPDFYFFTRVIKKNGSYPYGWLLGYISAKKFKDINYYVPKGEMQNNGFRTRTDTWNIKIGQLDSIDKILSRLK